MRVTVRLFARLAVNADYSRLEAHLEDGDEVAFLPPVSGG